MRRSTRDRKAVEFFNPATYVDVSSPSDGESSEDEDAVVDVKSKKVSTTKVKGTLAKAKQSSGGGTISGQNILFESANHPKNISSAVDKFTSSYTSAGSQRSWIRPTEDLEGLNAEELEELLLDASTFIGNRKSPAYPLNPAGSKGVSFRTNYVKVWESLTSKIMTHTDRARLLSAISELLISLSSLPIPSLRHAVSEASLCMGRVLLKNTVDVYKKINDLERQTHALGGSVGSKLKAAQTMLKDSKKLLKALQDHITTLFNSIFIHRYKDSSEAVRSRCAWYLAEWILTDPERYFDDDYLKYIGWMCSDRSAGVRRQAVSVISQLLAKKQYAARLVNFSERFMDRFIEMAVGDADENVSLDTVKMLRTMQMYGFLDELDQNKLDTIDHAVFDASASPDVRAEVLGFVMDHTEGFDEDSDLPDETVATNKRNRPSTASSSTGANTLKKRRKSEGSTSTSELAVLARKRKIAIQIETFLEFAELHLVHMREPYHDDGGDGNRGGSLELVVLLADACLAIPEKSGIVTAWDVILSLLLHESQDIPLDTAALTSQHISILLRLFAASACRVHQWFHRDNKRANLPSSLSVSASYVNEMYVSNDDWEGLQMVLLQTFPALVKRFRGDSDHIELLVDLLGCCDTSAAYHSTTRGGGSSSATPKSLQNLVAVCVDMLDNMQQQNEHALCKLSAVLRHWMDSAPSKHHRSYIQTVIKKMMNGFRNKLQRSVELVVGSSGRDVVGGGNKKGKKSGGLNEQTDALNAKDSLYSAASSARKYAALWSSMDCREIIGEPVIDTCEDVCSLMTSLCSLLDEACALSAHDATTLTTTVESCGRAVWHMLLWTTREVYVLARERRASGAEGSDEDPDSTRLSLLVDTIVTLRENFINVLSTWMDCGVCESDTITDNFTTLPSHLMTPVAHLHCEAFKLIGDIRMAYPMKEAEYDAVKNLAWTPSPDLLQKMERVFIAEDLRIKTTLTDLANARDPPPSASHTASLLTRQLIENLLCPLSGSVYDIDHLNRRQAAALLAYITDPSVVVQKVVKTWVKMLKEGNVGKYLEAILVALKKSYEDKIKPLIAQHREEVERFGKDVSGDEDEIDYPVVLQDEGHELLQFAQKLAQTLGVGKARGTTKEFLVVFFRVGISYSLQELDHAGFLSLLEPFLRLLGDEDIYQVRDCLEEMYGQCAESVRGVLMLSGEATEYHVEGADGDGGVNEYCMNAFADFSTRLGSTVVSRAVESKRNKHAAASARSEPPSTRALEVKNRAGSKRVKVTRDVSAVTIASSSRRSSMRSQSASSTASSTLGRYKEASDSEDDEEYEEDDREEEDTVPAHTRSQTRSRTQRSRVGRYSTQSSISDITMDDDVGYGLEDDEGTISTYSHRQSHAQKTSLQSRSGVRGSGGAPVASKKATDFVLGLHIEEDFGDVLAPQMDTITSSSRPTKGRKPSSASVQPGRHNKHSADIMTAAGYISPVQRTAEREYYMLASDDEDGDGEDEDFFEEFEQLPTTRRRR